MKLFIVESYGKVKKIQQFLGSDWKVAASVGHVRDLPVRETGVYPPDFIPRYVLTERGEKVCGELARMAREAESVWLATDADREGEAIAWHLQQVLKLDSPRRVTYTEITAPAVKKAVEQAGEIDQNLVSAQEGRRVLDRLVGYSVSPALNQVSGMVLSAGRVQTPALRLVVEREEAIRGFSSTTHYGVEMKFDGTGGGPAGPASGTGGPGLFAKAGRAAGASGAAGVSAAAAAGTGAGPGAGAAGTEAGPGAGIEAGPRPWKAVWNSKNWLAPGEEYFTDKAAAQKIAELRDLRVSRYDEGSAAQGPPPPFITSTLQQAASNALKIDPKECMRLAQALYEEGLITYMRTDNPNLSAEAAEAVRKLAREKGYPLPDKRRTFKSKEGAQEAHEAIRPTDFKVERAGKTEQERALYDLVRKRAVASQLADAKYATVKAVLESRLNGKKVLFEAKGRRLDSPGWKAVLGDDQANEGDKEKDRDELTNPVPGLAVGDSPRPSSSDLKTRRTTPPLRYTQAALIRDLEKRGIGRPSTYASILDNITARQYVVVNQKRLLEATGLGEKLLSYLKSRFKFANYEYTRNLEEKLDGIAKGQNKYFDVVQEAYGLLQEELGKFMTDTGNACPDCGQAVRHLFKEGDGGYNFWACSNRTDCGAKFMDQGGVRGPKLNNSKLSEHLCPACGKPLRHILKEGPTGYNYWSCSDRTCGTSLSDEDGKPGAPRSRPGAAADSGHFCRICDKPLRHVVKEGEGGYDFWGCSDIAACGATYRNVDGLPGEQMEREARFPLTEHACSLCGKPLRHVVKEGPGGYNFWGCSDRGCNANYKDDDGRPGELNVRVLDSDHKCEKCGKPLRHVFKEGPGGYDFWGCSDRECGASYGDEDGRPGALQPARPPLSEYNCDKCGKPLRHVVKEGDGGYNFWGCSDRGCNTTYADEDGRPGAPNARYVDSEYNCDACGQPLRHIVREGEGGYNFWGCSDRGCGTTYKDDDGKPGVMNPKVTESEHSCECGRPLKHIVKDGPGGYNFWGCSDRDCGNTYRDADGRPGEKNAKYVDSEHPCEVCGKPLRHIVKDGPNGYNFWGCSDRSCRATYPDEGGRPGPKNARDRFPDSEHDCECGKPLRHIVKEGEGGYNFWGCSDRGCGNTYRDAGGRPGEKNAKFADSEHKCEACGKPLRHIVKEGPNGYDFWGCSDRACRATYPDDGGKPGPRNSGDRFPDSEHACETCGKPLRHIVKEGDGGYNFWGCSDRSCGTTYKDADGRPGERNAKFADSEHKCEDCGKPLRHIVKEGPNGYDFWGCSDRACRATYPDEGGKPGRKNAGSRFPDSEHACETCGKPLRHIVKEGEGGYNFWGCSDRSCGTTYRDDDGRPGERNFKTERTVSQHPCEVCGKPLVHIVRDGPNGFNFWGCSDRACNTSYSDDLGKPGPRNERRAAAPPSEHKCPTCGSPLYHKKGYSERVGSDYNFFACSNRGCNLTYKAVEDKPVFDQQY
ncbi:MAG: type I DNA topoisomerase [Deltaproteobacteria bacterium]|jgi:DNA topoisomerase-1|nr:type I DNA topoisomerase [Deltaproteobacteria bacterium]